MQEAFGNEVGSWRSCRHCNSCRCNCCWAFVAAFLVATDASLSACPGSSRKPCIYTCNVHHEGCVFEHIILFQTLNEWPRISRFSLALVPLHRYRLDLSTQCHTPNRPSCIHRGGDAKSGLGRGWLVRHAQSPVLGDSLLYRWTKADRRREVHGQI